MTERTTTDPSTDTPPPRMRGPAAKWAALVNDTLVPLPRRRLKARDVLAQAGAPAATLVRDYNQPIDVPLPPDADIDLAGGNVFKTVEQCDARPHGPPTAPAKLAFVADDAWEITTNPNQTLESLRGLFGLPDGAELFRDLESPNDEPITPDAVVRFEDGPVFRVRVTTITVKVNNKSVRFTKRKVTGLEVKQTAIDQKVAIELNFVVYPVKPEGGLGKAIPDDKVVVLKECDEFRCVAPDDNS